MDINKLLKGIDCECGKHHSCDIKAVYVEENALKRLYELCKDYNNILVIADENTISTCDLQLTKILGDKCNNRVIFTGSSVLVPDSCAIKTVEENLDGIDLLIGVGSGVIQDLTKYTAYNHNLPFFDVATAPSMDGYASTVAAMLIDGVKISYIAKNPDAIIADVNILKNAPMEMIKAGFGDVMGKFSALNDWELGRILYGEYFCQYIYDLTYEMVKNTLDLSDGLLKRDEKSIQALMEALVGVGIAMSFSGNSRPASGSEHHISHVFEIRGLAEKVPYFSHGIDVAYSAVLTSKIRDRLSAMESFDKPQFKDADYDKNMYTVYKDTASGYTELQRKAGRFDEDRVSLYVKNEAQIKELFKKCPSESEMIEILKKVDLNMDDFYNMYPQDKIDTAILYAKELRDRFSVLWMNYDLQ